MPSFSKRSLSNLGECHIDLQTIFSEVVKTVDCTIIQGHRTEAEQNQMYAEKKSKVKYPDSKHNSKPSMAVDVAPYPIQWENTKGFYFFAGFVMATAERLYAENKIDHKVRWGGDFNMNFDFNDQSFLDLVHIELL